MRTAGGLAALVVATACGGKPVPSTPAPLVVQAAKPVVTTPVAKHAVLTEIDPLAAVSIALDDDADEDGPPPAARLAYLVPGRVQLEVGSPFIEGPGGNVPMRVGLFGRHGQLAHVAVRLANARFALWTESVRMLAVLQETHEIELREGVPAFDSKATVSLNAGAPVRRVTHEGTSTKIRYEGALEVEGWVPDAILGDSSAPHRPHGRIPTAFQTELVMTGAAIRTEMQWSAQTLATVSRGYLVSVENEIDDDWEEVSYSDDDVYVRGFLGRHEPPSRVHYVRPAEVPPPTVVTNTKLPSGTCLYSSVDGDPIGYLVDDPDVELEPANAEWWTITVDTPWGPIAFAGKGPTEHDLVACAPDGAVAPSQLTSTAQPPPISVP